MATIYECRLNFFKKTKIGGDDVTFSPKEIMDLKCGHLLEIFFQINEKHFLVKIDSINTSNQQKVPDTLHVDQTLANSMGLQQGKTIKFRIYDAEMITLDVMDLIIKDQYFSRSDMFRFSDHIRSLSVFEGRKLEFSSFRGTIGDLWCRGKRITAGYVDKDTRVVYRSKSSVVHIFIQMSHEMLDFDYFGDNYFEKAINFISDLFNKWNDHNCGHDVTIVLYSRLYVKSNEDDIEKLKKHLKMDFRERFFQDFYSVVVQNERYMISEWRKVIKTLRLRFNTYKSELDQFIAKILDTTTITMELSSAEESNFLETLNMTLNLYENYYIDRNFDRSGKICVVITAGSGVFNVDRTLTNLTKQRISDLGVGIDLVCVGEQPLHAVPLFIFHKKDLAEIEATNDYCIPYWINHSFYRSQNELQAIKTGQFIPRIKVRVEEVTPDSKTGAMMYPDSLVTSQDGEFHTLMEKNDVLSYEDASVLSTSNNTDRGMVFSPPTIYDSVSSKDDSFILAAKSGLSRGSRAGTGTSGSKTQQHLQRRSADREKSKALINPFISNRLNIRATTNSRRWSHVFPIDKFNKPIQMHHKLAMEFPSNNVFQSKKPKDMGQAWQKYYRMFICDNPDYFTSRSGIVFSATEGASDGVVPGFYEGEGHTPQSQPPSIATANTTSSIRRSGTTSQSSLITPLTSPVPGTSSQKSLPLSQSNTKKLASSNEEHKWNWSTPKPEDSPINHLDSNYPFSMIGVDWKSLTMPAMLPVTSDYFPDPMTLDNQFMEVNYQLMSQSSELNDSLTLSMAGQRKPLSIDDVFKELIYLRLNQGFQVVTSAPRFPALPSADSSSVGPVFSSAATTASGTAAGSVGSSGTAGPLNKDKQRQQQYTQKQKSKNMYRLCIGRMFHCLVKQQDRIVVTQYLQKHSDSSQMTKYSYGMKMPDSTEYMKFRTQFELQKNFVWNYYDNYILNYGLDIDFDSSNEFKLQSCVRFWRSRFLLVPTHPSTKTLMEDKREKPRCDIYRDISDQGELTDEFLRFMEVVNRFKRRVQSSKKSVQSACVLPLTTVASSMVGGSHSNGPPTGRPQRHSLAAVRVTDTASLHDNLHCQHNHYYNHHQQQQQYNNLSNPATPIEKIPKQFTFDSNDSNVQAMLATSSGAANPGMDGLLPIDSSVDRLIKAMEDRTNGLLFLPPLETTRLSVFTSYECVNWCRNNVTNLSSVQDAVDYLQILMTCKDFVNLNSSLSHKFSYGFVLYMLNSGTEKRPGSLSLENLATTFFDASLKSRDGLFEWAEVLLADMRVDGKLEPLSEQKKEMPLNMESSIPANHFEFLMQRVPHRTLGNVLTPENFEEVTGKRAADDNRVFENGVMFRKVILEMEENPDESRIEWGVFQHQANYHTSTAFECMLHWLVATGIRLSDKISQWTRRLVTLQLVPVPCDPFALPSSIRSDPLRGPIFVPLALGDCLQPQPNLSPSSIQLIDTMFAEYPEAERKYRLMLMQEVILKRFGFVRENCVDHSTVEFDRWIKTHDNSTAMTTNRRYQWTYVHCSGGMFAMLPCYDGCQATTSNFDTSDGDLWKPLEIGFLWSWNKMLPKKLSASLADEAFQDKMLADFRCFCRNEEGRLVDFYQSLVRAAAEFSGAASQKQVVSHEDSSSVHTFSETTCNSVDNAAELP